MVEELELESEEAGRGRVAQARREKQRVEEEAREARLLRQRGGGERGPHSACRRDPMTPNGFSGCVWCKSKVPSSDLSSHLLRCKKQRKARQRVSSNSSANAPTPSAVPVGPFDTAAMRNAFVTPSARKKKTFGRQWKVNAGSSPPSGGAIGKLASFSPGAANKTPA